MKMKRTLKALLLVTLAALSLTACNQQIIDMQLSQTFNTMILKDEYM